MTDTHDTADLVSKALRRAWQLGQTYWQQADSEYQSHWKKADATQATFDQLVEDTRAAILTSNSGAQPAPSLASNDVSLISEGKTQPAQSVKDVIIDDLQSQFDTEGITEHDSGDALIRLSDAIAAVEDNFTHPDPIIPEGWKLVPIEPTPGMMRGAHRLVAAARRVLASADSHGLIRLDESGDVASELRSALEADPEAKP